MGKYATKLICDARPSCHKCSHKNVCDEKRKNNRTVSQNVCKHYETVVDRKCLHCGKEFQMPTISDTNIAKFDYCSECIQNAMFQYHSANRRFWYIRDGLGNPQKSNDKVIVYADEETAIREAYKIRQLLTDNGFETFAQTFYVASFYEANTGRFLDGCKFIIKDE